MPLPPAPLSSAPLPLPQAARPDLPPISGFEAEVAAVMGSEQPVFLPHTNLRLDQIQSGFACALHMHQPTLPAPDGRLISHLQYMFDHAGEGDNHNASVFAWCYQRLGQFIPELVEQGCNPRIMLDYSGNLLWGFQQMQRHDILDALKRITCDPAYQPHVEWLGSCWSHAVVPSTPIPDLKLQIRAWQHHFAALFGYEALGRVRGFSPPEMHLPNHPDQLYQYLKALKDCGYRWLLVQEHSVETLEGNSLPQAQKYLPNRLVARSSSGETISITALIKTQGSDTKLVAQMQPYFEAKGLGRQSLADRMVPSLVSQIADGENGGVMMNEYPRDLFRVYHEIRDGGGNHQGTVALNGSEYLEMLAATGLGSADYPVCQAVQQHKLWQRQPENSDQLEQIIAELKQTDPSFQMDGASWTNHLSWVQGYENVLEPMNQLSAGFHQTYGDQPDADTARRADYQQALLYNLLLQTSCFRYWGQGTWTDYARELYQRGLAALP
ncbi:MAG: glycosyl hydrolase family 57 [Elainella sp.]